MLHVTSRPGSAILVLALVFAAAPRAARAQGKTYVVEHAGRSVEVPIRRIRGEDYLPLEPLENLFGFERVARGRRQVRLVHPKGDIELVDGSALVRVGSQQVFLSAEVRLKRRQSHVPIDFLTLAVARLLEAEPRHDPSTRLIRYDEPSPILDCEAYADRTRLTLQLQRPAELSDVIRDGRRRVVEILNQELPAQVGGCLFDDTLADLEVRPTAGRTRLTFFVGSRFANLKVYEVPDSTQLVFDFFNAAAPPARVAVTPVVPGDHRDVFDTVVIDPGHGGSDSGAVGPRGIREKDLTLEIAARLAALLRDRAGLDVHLTRERDEELGLIERTETANRERADLFLSIHANASVAGPAHGAETYFLHLDATDEAARTLAALENDATGLGARGGGDSGSGLEMLLWDMAQSQYLQESSRLAGAVQRELNALAGTRDRGVKQANFLVLRGATMPAVLVEVGFLSNPREESRMRTMGFQQTTAEALYRAVIAFRDERRARQGR